MSTEIKDQKQRRQAIDPARSFIVQAPAGSGKTDLLIKRFLRLLSCVNQPEEILAITFTKKATAEMRNRIISALNKVKKPLSACIPTASGFSTRRQGTSHRNVYEIREDGERHRQQSGKSTCEGYNENEEELLRLAKEAFKQNEKKQWRLLDNPNRLKIQTIDAFCRTLVNQMPMSARFGMQPTISDSPGQLYRQVVSDMLLRIDQDTPWQAALKQVLHHLDNQTEKVQELLINMLAKREQWLRYVLDKRPREKFEAGLKKITEEAIEQLEAVFPDHLISEPAALTSFADKNLDIQEAATSSPLQTNKQKWIRAANLLLTQKNEWRKCFDKRVGFPAGKNAEEKVFCKQMKERISALVKELETQETLLEALIELKYSPALTYSETQWAALSALMTLLPYAVSLLKTVFQTSGQVDFAEIAASALTALGTTDNPTDLALTLDYKIHHILVDEFQDTSFLQFRLLEKLTEEWQPGDGRTLFLVGDPMQSVYRFRDAIVGLFLRTFREGFHRLEVHPIQLSTNFRSNQSLIDWMNQTFSKIFPASEDIHAGAVTYAPATPARKNSDQKCVAFIHCAQNETEAEKTTSCIRTIKESHPNDSIAILVRARSNLTDILPALRSKNIPYQAVDIDPLKKRPVIQDLWSLTRALMHPADKIAWLSVLRSPLCGLTLKDLYQISETDNKTVWQTLGDPFSLLSITKDSREKLNHFKLTIEKTLKNRGRRNTGEWIEETWLNLKGAAYLKTKTELNDARAYFQLIQTLDINELDQLEEKLDELYSSPDTINKNSVQILTIHKAKGLEFDHIILPALDQKNPKTEERLMLWMERPGRRGGTDLIAAPIKARGIKQDSVYDYLKREDALSSQFEKTRLLYVAATRAKKSITLIDAVQKKNQETKKPSTGSFLSLLSAAMNDFSAE